MIKDFKLGGMSGLTGHASSNVTILKGCHELLITTNLCADSLTNLFVILGLDPGINLISLDILSASPQNTL